MPKSMREVHEAGQHRQYPRTRCPLCKAELDACKRALGRFGANDSFETETPPTQDPDMMVACDVFLVATGEMVWRSYGQRWVWTLTDKGRKAVA